jgi:hypothetical protein
MPKPKKIKAKPLPPAVRLDIVEQQSRRFITAAEMIKLKPLAHPRGKDGAWGH